MFFPFFTPQQPTKPPAYNPSAAVLPIQIIAFAMMQGILIFGAIAVLVSRNNQNPPTESLLAYIAAGYAVIAVVLRFIVPAIVARKHFKVLRETFANDNVEVSAIAYATFQSRTIIEFALLEGAGFFVLVAFITSRQPWLLGVAAALLALMAAWFPTKGRIEHFINDQKQQLEFESEQ